MIKQTALAALTLTAALTLVGCGTASDTTPPTTATTYRTTTTQQVDTAMSDYLQAMRQRFPSASDAKLIEVGIDACDVINAHGSLTKAMLSIASDPSWSSETMRNAGYTFGRAIPVFCPQYFSEMVRITQ